LRENAASVAFGGARKHRQFPHLLENASFSRSSGARKHLQLLHLLENAASGAFRGNRKHRQIPHLLGNAAFSSSMTFVFIAVARNSRFFELENIGNYSLGSTYRSGARRASKK
jgi:hypothetical protein